jgi:hypothetical protein
MVGVERTSMLVAQFLHCFIFRSSYSIENVVGPDVVSHFKQRDKVSVADDDPAKGQESWKK